MTIAPDDVLRLLFLDARSHNGWLDRPVDDALLQRIYEISRMGPTSANTQPLRVAFVKSHEAKERLRPALSPGNVDKTMSAPVTAIVAYDLAFYENLPKLFPHVPGMRERFAGMPAEVRDRMAMMNAWLQGGYVITAARALGLDCGPMAGFDNAKVDAAFFEGQTWRSAFLVNLGYGDPSKLFPRSPRLEFAEACRIV
jgi:3-hydroxypropanoate dehydrogenase